ncbi:hypothetical protein [Paenirhodobacter populi]|uniref:Uncharacterized protein n=1 Tax=Paenirhodobacter populi TaxID=2306993 RepID=A0A443IR74_9RHOB|nr:hypothetical protein [Sinirhodobacter populi]RWR09170.1 hypothetical protein D2T33_14310 [Sinirhodobacter populi]
MKNRGVFSACPRLPGMAHKTGGRPETLPGQIAAQGIEDRERGNTVEGAEPDRIPVPPAPSLAEPTISNRLPASAPAAKRKYSLSLRIPAELVAGFRDVLGDYPASDRKAIRRGLAGQVQARLGRDLPAPASDRAEDGPCDTIRLDLRLDPAAVATLQRHYDPHGLIPAVTVIARAVEPVYATLLRDVLRKAGRRDCA